MSLFGNTTQQPSLFGSSTQQQPQQSTSLFGNTQQQQPSQQAPQQQLTLFGQSSNTPQTAQPASSLFGSTSTPNAAQNTGSSLFGTSSTNTQGGPSSGLFGSVNPSSQNAGGTFGAPSANSATTTTGAGLFGSTNTNQSSQWNASNPLLPKSAFGQPNSSTGTGTSLFGTQQQQPSLFGQQQQQQQPSLFGQQQQQQQQPSLFGQQQQQQPQQPQPSSLFGSTGGSSLFGQQPQKPGLFGAPAMAPVPSVQMGTPSGPPPFVKSTKFNDLPDDVKRLFENIENHIQGRVQISNDLKQRKLGEEVTKGQELVRAVHKDLLNVITTLQSDSSSTRDLKARVDQTVQDTIAATHIVDGFRNPQQHGSHLRTHANFPLEYFMRVTDEMQTRLQWYRTTIEQIERKLTSTAQAAQSTPQIIVATVEAQNASFLTLANKVAAIDADLQRLKAVYTQLWRQKTGSMRDPFNELDRGAGDEFGVGSLYGK